MTRRQQINLDSLFGNHLVVTPKEFAQYMRVSRITVMRWIAQVGVRKFFRDYRLTRSDITRIMDDRKEGSA